MPLFSLIDDEIHSFRLYLRKLMLYQISIECFINKE